MRKYYEEVLKKYSNIIPEMMHLIETLIAPKREKTLADEHVLIDLVFLAIM